MRVGDQCQQSFRHHLHIRFGARGHVGPQTDSVQATPAVAKRPIWLGGDNRASPRLHWHRKALPQPAPLAPRYLLRLGALHQRRHRYVPQHDHLSGNVNVMADNASCLWHQSDDALLTHFASTYQHQDTSSPLQTLPDPAMLLAVIGTLSRQRSIPPNLRIAAPPPPPPGASGNASAPPPASSLTSMMFPGTLFPSFSSLLPTNTGPVASHPATGPSDLVPWRTLSAMWRRRSPRWGPWTLTYSFSVSLITACMRCSTLRRRPILLLRGSNRFRSLSCGRHIVWLQPAPQTPLAMLLAIASTWPSTSCCALASIVALAPHTDADEVPPTSSD